MTPKQLDAREQRFVQEYLLDLDPQRAAIAAGYAKTTARMKSYGWVSKSRSTKPHVLEAVLKAQEARLKRTDVNADWVLQRLTAEAEADVADLYDEEGRLKPVREWPLVWRQGLVQGLEVTETSIGEGDDKVVTISIGKIKLPDRIKRIELIGKHINVQSFVERREHSGPGGGPIGFEDKTPETSMELARRVLALVAKAEHAPKETQE